MTGSDEVTLWRAPSRGCRDPALEVRVGFEPAEYPGEGLYVATERSVAEGFAACYGNGLQELHMPRDLFEQLIRQGTVLPDGFYPLGQSWHVRPDGIHAFNAALRQGTPGSYYPAPP